MSQVLLSWIGTQDRRAATGQAPEPGPIGAALEARHVDNVVLLSNDEDPEWATPYLEWLAPRTSARIDHRHQHLVDPTDHEAIYAFVRPILEELTQSGAQLTVHLSSGTPSMHAVWLLLCKTQFAAELIQTSTQRGVQPANVPFDIYAELADRLGREAMVRAPETAAFDDIIRSSKAMREVIDRAARVAQWPVDVLIEGDSGTGKELFARAIHSASPRAGKPMVVVNCGAIPKDLVESELFGHIKGAFTGATATRRGRFLEADGGTLFLDELGELPLDAQVKLLRAVEYREVTPVGSNTPTKVDVRIVAATNRNLLQDIDAGRFREDLYYRLSNAILTLPPLRDRRDDISPLLEHALEAANALGRELPGFEDKKLSPGARNVLRQHTWPGNVRELMGTVRRAAIWSSGATIGAEDARQAIAQRDAPQTASVLHRPLGADLDLRDIMGDVARHYIGRALDESGGVKKEAAKLLGFSNYQTLSNWMKKYGVSEN